MRRSRINTYELTTKKQRATLRQHFLPFEFLLSISQLLMTAIHWASDYIDW